MDHSDIPECSLAKSCEVMLITGFHGRSNISAGDRGTSASTCADVERKRIAEENCWKLYCLLHNIQEYDTRRKRETSDRRHIILNKSSDPLSVFPENIRSLKEFVSEIAENETGITKVIFAHSHGVKVVREALNDITMRTFLINKKHVIESVVDDRLARIRQHLAVFGLGGVDFIPDNCAKIAYNLCAADDNVVISALGKMTLPTWNSNTLLISDDGKEEFLRPGTAHWAAIFAGHAATVGGTATVGVAAIISLVGGELIATTLTGGAALLGTGLVIIAGAVVKPVINLLNARECESHQMRGYLKNRYVMYKIRLLLNINDG